jgi:hypothetical protein
MCKQKIIIINHEMKKKLNFFNPHVHPSSTTTKKSFMKNPKAKM